jgi:hypothetical protein
MMSGYLLPLQQVPVSHLGPYHDSLTDFDDHLPVFLASDSETEILILSVKPGATQQSTSVPQAVAQHSTVNTKTHRPVSCVPQSVPPSEDVIIRMGFSFHDRDFSGEAIINPWLAD